MAVVKRTDVNGRAQNSIDVSHASLPSIQLPVHSTTQSNSWNKYTSIASRALRQALNETDRVAAEKRAVIGV